MKEGSAVAASEMWPIAADPAVIVESVVEKQFPISWFFLLLIIYDGRVC